MFVLAPLGVQLFKLHVEQPIVLMTVRKQRRICIAVVEAYGPFVFSFRTFIPGLCLTLAVTAGDASAGDASAGVGANAVSSSLTSGGLGSELPRRGSTSGRFFLLLFAVDDAAFSWLGAAWMSAVSASRGTRPSREVFKIGRWRGDPAHGDPGEGSPSCF